MLTQQDNPLRQYFEQNTGRLIDKWMHYFEAYHRHFERFRGKRPTIVEVGVFHGGSLQMWKHYFGEGTRIIGIDINPRVKTLEEAGVEIIIGDQSDRNFWRRITNQLGSVDIFIDDGGHTMAQQLITFEEMFLKIAPNGVYLCEDLHTSYWREYGGGYRSPFSFVEYSKNLIDQLHAWHSRDPHSFSISPVTQTANSLHFYDSMLFIEKRPIEKPTSRMTGTPSFNS
jgi:SAM-dependent methyltransferase